MTVLATMHRLDPNIQLHMFQAKNGESHIQKPTSIPECTQSAPFQYPKVVDDGFWNTVDVFQQTFELNNKGLSGFSTLGPL